MRYDPSKGTQEISVVRSPETVSQLGSLCPANHESPNSCLDPESVSASAGFPLIIPESVTMTTECFVGIDVSKASLEVAIHGQEATRSFGNTLEGHAELVAYLQPLNPTRIVLEASGGFEIEPMLALMSQGLPVSVVNPARMRSFAKAHGRMAKTDRIDAHLLAHFAQAVRPRLRSLQSEQETHLKNLVRRRRQVVAMLTAEKNRLHTTSVRLQTGVKKHIQWLQEEENELAQEIAELIQSLP